MVCRSALPLSTANVNPATPPPNPRKNNSYTARFISFLLNCCIFLSVVAFILSTMDQFKCVR
jgi:hypothetical protein